MASIRRSNVYLCLFHADDFPLILQKLGEWDENLLSVPVTGLLNRAISAHAFLKCVPKEIHASTHCQSDAQRNLIADVLSQNILPQDSLDI